MEYDLQGRTCLVTGASSGIGAGIVRLLSEQGAKVVATARRADKIERLEGVTAFAADVTRSDDLKRVAALGPVEILVNCAGGSRPTTPDSGEDVWDEAFALNFTAVRKLTTALLPAMRARKWGRIVNISGSMEPRGLNAAIAAKGALHLWAKGLSCDIAADGVTLNTIQPGRIDSEQIREKLHPTEEIAAQLHQAQHPDRLFRRALGHRPPRRLPRLPGGALHHRRRHPGRRRHALFRALTSGLRLT